MTCDLLIKNIKGLVQVRSGDVRKVSGSAMSELPVLADSYLAIHNGLILDYGPMSALPGVSAREVIDATGAFVFPSFVDSHTHIVFAAGREEEFVMKIRGATYQEIAARGGGILNSARKLRDASEDELFDGAMKRVAGIIRTGTGAVEIKSGYGLTVADELKMLRVARKIGAETLLTVRTTLLGAHAVPPETGKERYIRVVIEEMIPQAAEAGLADYVDVFCEDGYYSPEETEKILEAGLACGLKPRVHANQLGRSGGVQAGVGVKALSVDHLENIGGEEISLLKKSETMPTALPGAAFFLGLPFTPVREMIREGLPVAIASDYNPGSAPTGNMALIVALACIKMKMTPEEAFNAATLNTAFALELSDVYGSITRGKVASVFITSPMHSVASMPYHFGTNLIDTVILKGRIVHRS